MKLLILQGLPGSGKSTWAKDFIEKNPNNWVRINRDDLRSMRHPYWVPKQEDMITLWEDMCVYSALEKGLNVILDSTNLNKDRVKNRVGNFKTTFPDLKVEYKFFDTPIKECIKNDLKRANSVGEEVINNLYNKYLAPEPAVYKEDTDLPKAIIVDVDGTLAKRQGRSPFDWERVKEDRVNTPIKNIVNSLKGRYHISIFTGRDGSCLHDTREWLEENGIHYDSIFNRPEGNKEKDSVIKKRLFEQFIRGEYYVDFVLDDRDQIVNMWRQELGLTCLQVDYGNF